MVERTRAALWLYGFRTELGLRRAAQAVRQFPAALKALADYTTDPHKNSVIPSLILYYMLCSANGAYNTFVVTAPTQVLEEPLLPFQYQIFVWVTFVAPLITMLGMTFRGRWEWTGCWMQLFGNVGVAGVLWTYIAALIQDSWWGKGNFSGTWVMASAVGAIVFSIRDVRRIRDPKWVTVSASEADHA